MALSVQTTNTISKHLLQAGVSVGSYALAAVTIGSPIGVTGGALVGSINHVTGRLANHVLEKYVGLKDPQVSIKDASLAVKVLAISLLLFASIAITFKALALAGFALTLKHLIILNITSCFAGFGIGAFLQCAGVDLFSAFVARPQHA